MIDYIKGSITELNPTYVVVDNNGIGYMMNISLTTYDQISKNGQDEALLYVHESIREDAHTLYGFASKREREAFMLLISVSGVGPNTARMVLSSMTVDEFSLAIVNNNVAMFKAVKGVGGKTAQRIIVDLKDKIKPSTDTLLLKTEIASGEVFDEALAALVMLGFPQQTSQRTLKSLFKNNPSLSVEAAIKQALKMM